MRLLLGALAVMAACRADAASRKPTAPKLAHGAFRIAESGTIAAGGTRYVARAGDRCAFEIEVAKPQAVGGSPFPMTTVALVRRRDADCASFLRKLAPALGFKGEMPTPRPIPKLEVAAVIVGTNQMRSPSGHGFVSVPPGHWTTMKLLLGGGEREVLLDLNADEKLGELSAKDEDAADEVVSELARILVPEKP